jgi:hypothetical protein
MPSIQAALSRAVLLEFSKEFLGVVPLRVLVHAAQKLLEGSYQSVLPAGSWICISEVIL